MEWIPLDEEELNEEPVSAKVDNVNHPSHYQTAGGLEVIDIIESVTEDLNGYEATHTGNALKYICRWKKKNGVEDLKKAVWYLNRLIEKLEGGNK